MPRMPERPAHMRDDYITSSANINHLSSSLGLFTRAENYITVFDANVYCSPEDHLRGCTLEEMDADYIWRLFVFANYLCRTVESHAQIIVLPGVAREMGHLNDACLSAARSLFSSCRQLESPEQRNQVAKEKQTLEKYIGALEKYSVLLEARKEARPHPVPEIHEHILELVKILDRNLGLKKATSVKGRDTDECLVAEAFYQVLVENHNCAVYSRDEDIKNLITMTFRFLVAGDLFAAEHYPALQNLRYKNLVLMVFDIEKITYNRVFESLTTQYSDRFNWPRGTTERAKQQILDKGVGHVRAINACFERALAKVQALDEEAAADPTAAAAAAVSRVSPSKPKKARPRTGLVSVPKPRSATSNRTRRLPSAGRVTRALRSLYEHAKTVDEDEELAVDERIGYFEALRVVAEASGEKEVLDLCDSKLETLGSKRLGRVLGDIDQRVETVREELGQLVASFSASGEMNIDFTQSFARLNQQLQGLLLERRFYKVARSAGRADTGPEHLLRYKELLAAFGEEGTEIGSEAVGILVEDIERVTGLLHLEVIHVIEAHKLKHEANTVFLNVDDVVALVI